VWRTVTKLLPGAAVRHFKGDECRERTFVRMRLLLVLLVWALVTLPAWAQDDEPQPAEDVGPVAEEMVVEPTADPTPTEIPTPLPTATIEPLPTPLPEPSPTQLPTATPTPTLTVSAIPSRTESPARTATVGVSQDRYNCRDFSSQAAAQAILRQDATDPNRLDPDRDGIACESNPAPKDLVPVTRR
jgi:hypothetical protein